MTAVDTRVMKYFVEFVGTFVFLSVILVYAGTQYAGFAIGLALGIVILAFAWVSGGHFNPAVSTMFAIDGALEWVDWAFYVVAQVAGGVCALYYYKAAKNHKFVPPNEVFSPHRVEGKLEP
jgi:aquaporin Z